MHPQLGEIPTARKHSWFKNLVVMKYSRNMEKIAYNFSFNNEIPDAFKSNATLSVPD